jgi:hypothetical protein
MFILVDPAAKGMAVANPPVVPPIVVPAQGWAVFDLMILPKYMTKIDSIL